MHAEGEVNIKFTHVGAKAPVKSHPDDAGYDCATPEPVTLAPGAVTKVPLGFCLEVPEGGYCQVAPRSGMASRGVWPVGGVIDPGYRGEVVALLYNSTGEEVRFDAGDRVCQLLFHAILVNVTRFRKVLALTPSLREGSGLGSTGLRSPILAVPETKNVINPNIDVGW